MFRDEETETQHKRLPGDEPSTSEDAAVPEYLEGVRQPRREERPLIRPGSMKPQSAPRTLQISNGTRRVPSYPAWEKPPSPFEYPRLRGQEVHRPVKPLAIAALGSPPLPPIMPTVLASRVSRPFSKPITPN